MFLAVVGVRGREHDRVNRGRLGPKGMYAWQSMASKDRLTHPVSSVLAPCRAVLSADIPAARHCQAIIIPAYTPYIILDVQLIRNKTTGELEKATWDEAMSLIVEKAKDVQKRLTSHGIGFYTSGQLFLEEYVTLACIGKAGLGTLHMDGNTRLCTATAAATMRERYVAGFFSYNPSAFSHVMSNLTPLNTSCIHACLPSDIALEWTLSLQATLTSMNAMFSAC